MSGQLKLTKHRSDDARLQGTYLKVNERLQVFRITGGRFCLVQHDSFTNNRD